MFVKIDGKDLEVKAIQLKNGVLNHKLDVSMKTSELTIQMEHKNSYRFSLSRVKLSKKSVLLIANEDGTDFASFMGKRTQESNDGISITTRPLKGHKFIFKIISPLKGGDGFILDSLSYIKNESLINPDENGQFYSSELGDVDPRAYEATRPVGIYHGGVTESGTSWILGKTNLAISNSHVIIPSINEGGVSATLELLHDNTENGMSIDIQKVLKIGTVDPENDPNNDYGVVELDEFDVKYSRLAELIGGLSLHTNDDSLPGKTVYMPGHPGGLVQKTSYYSTQDINERCSILDVIEQQVKSNCFSAPGSSGSPIISADERKVIAMDWGRETEDDDNVYRGVKGTHIWNGIKSFVSEDDNSESLGLASKYPLVSRSNVLSLDEGWRKLASIESEVFFNGFTGTLLHRDTYTEFSAKAQGSLLEYVVDMKFRIAIKNINGYTNLVTIPDVNADPELVICITQEDNPDLFNEVGYYYRSWVSLEARTSRPSTVSGYFVFNIVIQS